MKLVLDTNIYCDYAEGVTNTVDIIAKNSESIYIPTVVMGELNYGFMKGACRALNEKKLEEIILRLKIGIIEVSKEVARKYGAIYFSLVKKGRKIPINDVWIAACCMEVGGTLLTRDKHFEAVNQIESIIL